MRLVDIRNVPMNWFYYDFFKEDYHEDSLFLIAFNEIIEWYLFEMVYTFECFRENLLRERYRCYVYFNVQIKCVVKRRIAVDSARNARFTGRMEWKMWQQSSRIKELRSVSIKSILKQYWITLKYAYDQHL